MADTDALVKAHGVTVRYGPKVAVDDVDFEVYPGEVMGLIGPNGAGKTSLVECIEGLRRASAGSITVAGLDPVADRAKLARVLGVQLQDSVYPTRIKVFEICDLFASFYPDAEDPEVLLEEFQLSDKRKATITKLSGGQRQRLSLVLALLGKPEVVFLDELTNGLDPQSRRSVWKGLKKRNKAGLTIVLTSHYMDEVTNLCDRVSVLIDGKVVVVDTVPGLLATYGSQAVANVEDASGEASLEDVYLYLAGADAVPADQTEGA
ncbi:ABC transporter ATP-binding protein [Natronoglycomyces albus]|uniref:ABC transporter ATP-binding protein n=1 Tax=Natronoglycomyces albus TaxID=2811108 RepID=A0A895XP02_9ACTN|nr:ABC transporter ATP-binding protein [Natronoglycomyces albus]QSB06867.1 ABC transporter ATP-binding protein [Natronoglycomyces albus]